MARPVSGMSSVGNIMVKSTITDPLSRDRRAE
jgi:hypothetical protein